VWKDRRTVQRIAVGASGGGRLAVAALPLMRLVAQWLRAGMALVGQRRRRMPPAAGQLRQAAQRLPVS
jgi:hypothetical protein